MMNSTEEFIAFANERIKNLEEVQETLNNFLGNINFLPAEIRYKMRLFSKKDIDAKKNAIKTELIRIEESLKVYREDLEILLKCQPVKNISLDRINETEFLLKDE